MTTDNLPYQVINPSGTVVLHAPESCRSSRRVELIQLESGYTIRLHGRRITKTELRNAVRDRRSNLKSV